MMDKKFQFIYIILSILVIAILIQGYLLYDFKKSVEKDSVEEGRVSLSLEKSLPDRLFRKEGVSGSDPFEHMKKMQQEMQKSFGYFNSLFKDDPFFKEAFKDMGVLPLSDIKESDNKYTIELEIPGAQEKKIDIKTSGSRLTIRASTERSSDKNDTNYIHMERFTQIYQRSFTLKNDADLDLLTSSYKNGVLEIVIPKKI